MLEVHETLSQMHCAQWGSTMRELLSKALRVLTRAAKGSRGRQRWTFGVPADKGGGGKPGKRGVEEGQEGPHIR